MALDTLTEKQKGVYCLVILGLSNKEISGRLNISSRTVEAHREAIFKKMGVRNAVELVRLLLVTEKRTGTHG